MQSLGGDAVGERDPEATQSPPRRGLLGGRFNPSPVSGLRHGAAETAWAGRRERFEGPRSVLCRLVGPGWEGTWGNGASPPSDTI